MFMGLILQKVLQLNNVKGFIVKGRAPNANDVVGKARCFSASTIRCWN
jgi:hypothetical protein